MLDLIGWERKLTMLVHCGQWTVPNLLKRGSSADDCKVCLGRGRDDSSKFFNASDVFETLQIDFGGPRHGDYATLVCQEYKIAPLRSIMLVGSNKLARPCAQ